MKNRTWVVKWLPTLLTTLLGVVAISATAMAGTTPAISSATFESDVASNEVVVFFNGPVWGDSAHSTALAAADFSFTDGNSAGATSISSVVHDAGEDYAILVMNANAVAGDTADTIAAVANSIFTVGGALSEKTVALTNDAGAPTVTTIHTKADGSTTKFMITFSEPVFTDAARADVVAADFSYNDVSGANAASIASIVVSPDKRHIFFTTNVAIAAGDSVDTITPGANIFDAHGNPSAGTDGANSTQSISNTSDAPSISSVEAVTGSDDVLVTLNVPVFNAATCSGDLENADFTYTNTNASGGTALGDALGAGTAGTRYILLDLDANIAVADLTNGSADEVAPAATAIYNCVGTAATATGVDLDDTTDPVLLSATKDRSDNKNALTLLYSEPVQITGFTSASQSATSTSTVGDMTTGCTIAGFGAFSSGDIIYSAGANLVSNNSTQTSFTFNFGTYGNRTTDDTDCTGTFTPTADVYDLHSTGNLVETTSTLSTITTSTAWSFTGGGGAVPVEPPTNVNAVITADSYVKLTWDDAGSTSYVKIYRGIDPAPIDGGTAIASIEAGVGEYIDTEVLVGDKVSYVLKTISGSSSVSSYSDTITITVIENTTVGDTTTETTDTTDETTGDTTEVETTIELTYEEEQQQVKDLGVVTKEFDKSTNKCEAIVMISRSAGWEVDETVNEDGFDDTPEWCKPYAAKAKELGVVKGRTTTELGVEGEVNRYEIAVMLARVLGATEADLETAAEADLYDDELVEWAKGAVNWLNEQAVMTGYPDGTFGGANGVLKIELAVALGRAFELFVSTETSLALMATLTGANEVPPVETEATGSCEVTLEGLMATYTCTVEGLTVDSAHFHMGVEGENGDVLHTIEFDGMEAAGTWADLTEAQVTALSEGGVYVNVHTEANADGEIRGQVVAQ